MIEPDERGRVSLSKNSGNNAARFLNAAMVMCEDLGNSRCQRVASEMISRSAFRTFCGTRVIRTDPNPSNTSR